MRREVDPDAYCPQSALISEEDNQRAERRLARARAKYEAANQHKKTMAIQLRQRQQQMWMAGGAILVVALSLIWYKKQSSRKGKRRRGGDDLPRDLFLDEDDGFNGTEEELQQVFNEALKVARAFPNGMLDQKDQLMLYGLYKQAMGGDRGDDAPSKLNVVAYAKYDAWGKFKGLPKQLAMEKYCEVVYHFSTGGESSYTNGKDNDNADVVYDDDKHDDLDEDGCPINDNGDYDFTEMTSGLGIRPSTLSGIPEDKSRNESDINTPEVRLRNAAMSNDAELLKEVMASSCNIEDADELGLGALHYAADRGSVDCLKLLVAGGASVNAVDCDGIGVLQTALSAGLDIESLRILLEAGADSDACDQDGDSPRMWVSEDGDTDVVDLFALFPANAPGSI